MFGSLRAVRPPVYSAAQAVRSTHPRGHDFSSFTRARAGWLRCAGWLAACLVVMALSQTAQAGAYASANQLAAQWLEAQQNSNDGSWRDPSESRTFLQTAEAVLALHQANRRSSAYYAGQTWIENHDPKNVDARARRLLVLRATLSSAQPDIDALLAAVSTPAAGQSGWGLATRYRAAPLV